MHVYTKRGGCTWVVCRHCAVACVRVPGLTVCQTVCHRGQSVCVWVYVRLAV